MNKNKSEGEEKDPTEKLQSARKGEGDTKANEATAAALAKEY